MYAGTRFFLYIGGRGSGGSAAAAAGGSSKSDYATSEGVADAFHSVFHRTAWNFDHVLVDIPSIIHSVAFMSRDLVGHERDRETVRNAQRQLQAVILRRLQPRKSLALLFDGSEPLWLTERTRLFPGRRYDSKFYRSCASPMPHLLEEKLRATAMELRMPPWETMISGPATPGLSEGKMSAYLLDLATRVLRPPSHPSGLCPAVSANDTVCVVGAPELAWMGLGVTPFHNITAATLQQGELTCCSLQEMMGWLRLGHLMAPPAEGVQGDAAASKEDMAAQQQQRLAAVRTDIVFLHLLTNGHSATGLPQVLATPFANVLDAYREMEAEQAEKNHAAAATAAAEGNPARFRSLLFDEEPVTLAHLDRPSLRLRLSSLQKLLVRVYQALSSGTAGIPSSAKPTPHAATLLTWALQAHGLLCSGGVPSPCWTPTPDSKGNTGSSGMGGNGSSSEGSGDGSVNTSPGAAGTAMLDKYPKLALEQVIQHVGYLIQASATARGAPEPYFCPLRSRSFGLTGVESLLMTATQPDMINQILPLYVRGHTLPDAIAKEITSTRNVHEALRKTQQVVGAVVEQAERELAVRVASPPPVRDASGDAAGTAPHPALTHLPSHHFVRTMGSTGPPAGWTYYGVHLGMKAEAMNVRYSLNASDTATLRVIGSSALHPRDVLFVWAAKGCAEAEGSWIPVACVSVAPRAAGEETPAASASASASAGAAEAVSTLRVLTWNSQFNRHSGKETPLGRVGIDWCTPTRHVAASHVLAAAEADLICLQEVEPEWAAYLCAQPWVREGYAVTALESSPALTPYGVLFLVRRGVGTVTRVRTTNLPGSTGQVRTMPELTLRVGRGVAPIVVSGLHLLAPYSQTNETNRLSQLQRLEDDLEKQTWRPPAPVSAEDGPTTAATSTTTAAAAESVDAEASHILLGDFNDYPAKPYRLPPALSYRDAWEQLHPTCHRSTATAAERGFTIDGLTNPYTAKIIEQKFFGRPDRILYRSKQLQPIAAELVGTTAVTAVLPHAALTAGGPLMQVDKPAEAVPDYLYPSDHFGVLVEFQLV